jgi:hypothetical protein
VFLPKGSLAAGGGWKTILGEGGEGIQKLEMRGLREEDGGEKRDMRKLKYYVRSLDWTKRLVDLTSFTLPTSGYPPNLGKTTPI